MHWKTELAPANAKRCSQNTPASVQRKAPTRPSAVMLREDTPAAETNAQASETLAELLKSLRLVALLEGNQAAWMPGLFASSREPFCPLHT